MKNETGRTRAHISRNSFMASVLIAGFIFICFFSGCGKAPEAVAFCPYRISPLGAHIDHQYGKINGLAIDKGIHIAYSRKENGVVELQSLNFPKRVQFHVNSIPEEKVGDWADHMRGAALQLHQKQLLRYGISAVIEGTLPIGGLSSSAAVIIPQLWILLSGSLYSKN